MCIYYIHKEIQRERKRKRELVKEGDREIEGETTTDVFRIWGTTDKIVGDVDLS